MTSGGKTIRPGFGESGSSPFAPLMVLAQLDQQDPARGINAISSALDDFDTPATVHLQILDEGGARDWSIRSGPALPEQCAPANADVRLVMRRDTWLRIVQGSLPPFEALFQGKVAVGGDTELAKRLVEHLSDPSVPFVPPCQG